MFKNKKEIFSFRKYKAYGLASAVIASMFLAQGAVHADVVTSADGTQTTLSNDKASVTVDANHFKDSNDKTAKELYDAKEYEADKVTTGKDTVKGEYKTVVSYETEDGVKLKEDVTKTSTEDKELDYKVAGTSGKEYTGASTTTSTVNADLEKQNIVEKDGEEYRYVRTETSQGKETVLTETHFNDVETKASVEGMYNNDGSIKYDKIKDGSRVWVLEEKEDGTYGNYALIENAQSLSDEKIREAAKTATTKFSKAEVEKLGGIKETDSIVVYETNTYAARKQTSEQFGKDFYYEHTANSSNFYKSYIDDIYKVGLDGLEKQGDKYLYKGKEVPTIEDFKTNYVARTDGSEGLGEYPTDESNKYYIKHYGLYAVPTTYYDVLSDFLIAHPDSPIFAGKAKEVFWGDGEEEYYFNFAFVARLLNNSFKSKYNLNIDTQNFSNKPLDSKAEDSRPTEKTTYSFVRTDLKGDVDTFDQSHYGDQNDLWKHEIGSSYSSENVEKVRRWVKGYKSMNGESVTDPFNNKPTSEITQQEYIEAVFNNVFNFYLSTFKDQLEPEQIKELRAKFGDSVFNIVGNSVGADIDNPETYVVNGGGSHIFRNSLGVVTEHKETFTYHDVITPLRAYRLTASNNLVRHIYEQVNKQADRGSVIATHKDTKGKELAPAEKIVTDVPDGESYTTNEKSFPNKSVIERQPDGSVRIRITGYRLTKTPENKNGRVKGGSIITVPYVYEEVEIANIENKRVDKPKSEIPKDAPKVDIEAVKLTRFMLEDRKTEIKPHVEGFVEPIEKIGNYAYTGVTDSDEGGAVVTHIYKSVKAFELPKDAPVHDKPEYNGGAVPNEAPVHDKPEYNGGAVPNDAPVHDKPEFNGGVIPNDAPVHDKPEFNGGVIPNDAPVHDKPEYNGGAVPNDAPVHDKPEFNGDAVPNEAPVHDKPEFNGNVSRIDSTAHSKPELKIPAQSVETPVAEVEKPSQPVAQKPQEKYATKELPNTGSEASMLGLVGLATAIGSIGLLKFKKDDSE